MNPLSFDLTRPNLSPRTTVFAFVASLVAGFAGLQTQARAGDDQPVSFLANTSRASSGPWVSLYGEAYNSDNQRLRDIRLYALSAEFNWRPDRPLLRPFSIGALVSLYGTEGDSFSREEDPRESHDATAYGISTGFIARTYPIETERWSVFTEISGSLVWFERPFPPRGTPFDGVMRAGGGVTAKLSSDLSLVAGARWLHISNGGSAEKNPAYDALGGYIGITRPWGRGERTTSETTKPTRNEKLGLAGASTGVTMEYYGWGPGEFSTVDLHAMNSEFVYTWDRLPWLPFVGSMSLYYVSGDGPADPNRGLGLFNEGSVGYGFNVGVRPTWRINERFAVFAEAHGGILAFTGEWPFLADKAPYYRPWDWRKGTRVGVGVSWRVDQSCELISGYRRLRMDTSDERPTTIPGFPGDVPDYEGGGFFLGLQHGF